MNILAIYQRLCLIADPAREMEQMGDDTLAALAKHLSDYGVTTGVPGIVTGLVEIEIVRRWTAEHAHAAGAVGEGAN
jgi:hypothetical protein